MQWLKVEREKAGKDEGGWLYSYRFGELRVARDMNLLPPSRWDGLSIEDKEEVFALWKSQREMEAWEGYLEEKRLEKIRKRKGQR